MKEYFDEFKEELLETEKLLWSEKATKVVIFDEEFFFISFILPLLYFTKFLENNLALLALALLLFSIKFYRSFKRRENFFYALTNLRIIIIKKGFYRESINIKILDKVAMRKQFRDRGTLKFYEKTNTHGDFFNGDFGARQVVLPKLENVKNVEMVYNEILKVQGYIK